MLEISWEPEDGTPTTIDFDCSVTERYEGAADVTEFPVERGANVTDHVRAQNESVTLEAIVTNTPVVVPTFGMEGATGSPQPLRLDVAGQTLQATTLQFSQAFDRVRAVDEALRALRDVGQVLTVRTGVREIADCVIARYQVERDAEKGNALHLTLELRRLRIVTTQRVQVEQPALRSGHRSQNRGSQPATEPSPEDRRTILARLQDRGAGGGN
jgi:hypothetical protein